MSYTDKRKQADLLQQKISAYGELSADVKKKINYKFRLDWNYYSNSMEGNTLTMDETRSVMVGNLTVGGKPIKDVLEMKGHDEVVMEILKIGKGELRLSEHRIKEIHRAIMHEEDESKRPKIGTWKTEPNYIYNYKNERFDFVQPNEVPERMHNLLDKTNAAIDAIRANKKDAPHPLDVALEFHLEYVVIHPFYDGNGRTARILTNLLLISFGYPPFWVKTNERSIYNQYIGDIQGYGGNPDLFYEFAATMIIRSQQLVLDAIEGKDIEEPDDIDKRIEMLKKRLNNPDVVTESKSLHSTNEVLGKSIFPMLQHLEEKVEKLKDLFHSADRRMQYTERGTAYQLGSNESKWETLYTNWLTSRTPQKENIDLTGISEFTYTYRLKGYKKSLKLQYVNIYLSFQFNEFDYSIRINNDYQSEKRFGYSQPLDEKIATQIVRDLVDKVLKQIEEVSDFKD
jgi:Fic family protein